MDEKQTPREEQPGELAPKMSQWQQANPQATLTEIEEAVEAELAKLLMPELRVDCKRPITKPDKRPYPHHRQNHLLFTIYDVYSSTAVTPPTFRSNQPLLKMQDKVDLGMILRHRKHGRHNTGSTAK